MKTRTGVPVMAAFLLLRGLAWSPGGCDSEPKAIQTRLEKAKKQQASAVASLSPLERDLVFFANFENDGVAFLGNSGLLPLDLPKDHYRPGKFGRGYYFEKPRHNMLPAAMADVETDTAGFKGQNGCQLSTAPAERVGKRALSVALPGPDAGFETVPVKVMLNRHDGSEKVVTLLASCFVKGPKEAKVKVELALAPKALPPPANASEKPAPLQPDQSSPQEVTLTGEWQRVACSAKADARLQEREATFSLKSVSSAPLALLADGFQFEQAAYYPHHHLMPTTWTPGGRTVPATFVDLNAPALREAFPTHEGTLTLWTSTPHSSNLTNQGNIYWLSFGVWWHDPQWGMSTYIFQGGEKFCYSRLPGDTLEGNWHHLAMAWDAAKGYEYKDGKLLQTFDRTDRDVSKRLELYRLRLGGSVNDGQAANSIMDEVALFKRKLSDEELAQLAAGNTPLRATPNKVLMSPGQRTVYYRNEPGASLEVNLTQLVAAGFTPAAVLSGRRREAQEGRRREVQEGRRREACGYSVDCAVGEMLFLQQPVTVAQGHATARFEFSPSQLKCGSYPVRVGTVSSGGGAYAEFTVDVVPALRPDSYTIASWNHGGETEEWRKFCQTVGVNTIDTYDMNFDTLGKSGFLYSWHYNFFESGGVWSPQNRANLREQTRRLAEQRAPFPNWHYTLLNSEVPPWPVPDAKERAAWFDAWVQKELGFTTPEKGFALGTCNNPISCWFPEGEKPGKDGIYQPTNEFKFLKWWYNRGCGWWRLNGEVAGEIRKLRPDTRLFTEPMWYPGQVADLDAGSTWSYQVTPEPLIGEFETSAACVRGSNKAFYATLGMNYVSGDWLNVTEPDGVKKLLMPTPDDMIQQTWIAIGYLPTSTLAYWFLDGWFDGLRGKQSFYCPPESDVKLGAEIRQNLLPLGTMLKGAPNAQRPLALLLPESTLWPDAGEGGWGWGTAHYPNHWKNWVGSVGIPYDIVLDNNLTPGALAKYKVVIFPMAEYVSEQVYKELTAAGNAGTKIIVDTYCHQEYPNMERWDQEYYYRMSDDKRKDYGKATEKRLAELRVRLLPELDAYAIGEEGKVLTNVREYGGVRYVVVINNNRQGGPYTEWTKKPEFKPYGKAQQAKVYVRAPKDRSDSEGVRVVYEFTQSRRLETTFENGHVVATVDLPPHAGRVLCVYPKELKSIGIAAPGPFKRGAPGWIDLAVLDAQNQPAKGRQLLEVKVLDPAGAEHDESGLYRAVDGKARVPFRPAINDAAGKWTVEVKERTTGLAGSRPVAVAS